MKRSPAPLLLTTRVAELVAPEMEATDLVPAPKRLAVNWNLAEAVAVPPKTKSVVELFGKSIPF